MIGSLPASMGESISPILALVQVSGLRSGPPFALLSLLTYWAGSFVSLCIAVGGLNVFSQIIESDTEFMDLKKELLLAAFVSIIEGAGVWVLAGLAPATISRGIFLPLAVAGVIYQVAHYDSWGRYEAAMLLLLQMVIALAGICFVVGQFQTGFLIIGCCVLFLVIFGAIARSF